MKLVFKHSLFRCRRTFSLVVSFLLVSTTVWAQVAELPDVSDVTGAVVDESSIGNVYHVRQDGGNDSHGGKSLGDALKTVGAAMDKAMADLKGGTPTKILIYEGTYRESLGTVDFGSGVGKTSLLVIEGKAGEDVILSGSKVYTDWASSGSGVFEHSWTRDWGNVWAPRGGASLLAYRSEMVFVNGQALRQKILEDYSKTGNVYDTYVGYTAPQGVLETSSFGVAERSENGDKLFVKPPAGVNMSSAKVEVAVRKQFANFTEKEGLVLRNLTVQHFANTLRTNWLYQYPIEFAWGSKDILVEGCTFRWNNQFGATFRYLSRVTVRNCIFSYNGGSGNSAGNVKNSLWENNVTNFNNWRNYWGGATDWFLGGMKHFENTEQIMRGQLSVGNLATGCWWDIINRHQELSEIVSVLNHGAGFFYEISEGPMSLSKSLIAMNALSREANLQNIGGAQTTFQNNIIYGTIPERNNRGNFRTTMYPRQHGNTGKGLEKGEIATAKMTLKGNLVMGGEDELYTWYFSENPRDGFLKNDYRGEDNYFWHASGSSTGHFRAGPWDDAPVRDYESYLTWAGASEVNSSFADPGFEDPANLDFRFKSSSPLKAQENKYLAQAISPELLQECQAFWDWVGYDKTVPSGVPPGPIDQQTSYGNGGAPWSVNNGSVLELENYDQGGQGVAYSDTDAENQGSSYRSNGVDLQATSDAGGGFNVGWTQDGEWLEYTVNVAAGTYDLVLRAASGSNEAVGDVRVKLGSTTLGTFAVENSGGWQNWQDVVLEDIALSGGVQVLRLEMVGSQMNLNRLSFTSLRFFPDPNKWYYVENKACASQSAQHRLDADDCATVDLSAGGAEDKQWRFELSDDGSSYFIINRACGTRLDADDCATVDPSSNGSGDDKRWLLTLSDDGSSYFVSNKACGTRLDADDCQAVDPSSNGSGDDKRWQLVEAGSLSARQATEADKKEASLPTEVYSEVVLYPNPAQREVRVQLPDDQSAAQLRVLDLTGRVVLEAPLRGSEVLDIQTLPKGLYTVRVRQGAVVISEKLLVE
ncbi:carbohydrate-binding protein [Tunicatimonas pelagia]|uniref:carbohydrate-binding protein n=1 Tax=Tunicatimonas pelagia TaxID=931531 RepID=UPI002666855A|nr:carbohydrate-binding protein [Tunicatimonas pelagia]WKN44878.1 carbohydrate-binding protein [Tunicatimonas pelagia]